MTDFEKILILTGWGLVIFTWFRIMAKKYFGMTIRDIIKELFWRAK